MGATGYEDLSLAQLNERIAYFERMVVEMTPIPGYEAIAKQYAAELDKFREELRRRVPPEPAPKIEAKPVVVPAKVPAEVLKEQQEREEKLRRLAEIKAAAAAAAAAQLQQQPSVVLPPVAPPAPTPPPPAVPPPAPPPTVPPAPPISILPPVPFPDATPIGQPTAPWYLHPVVLVGGGVIGAVVLMKVLKR
jgi:hypothetical protein